MSTVEYETFSGFPMPRDAQALRDRSRRPIVRTQKQGEKRFPFPVPDGWFVVAESRDLDPGQTMALYVFGRDVVLFRTESGEVRMRCRRPTRRAAAAPDARSARPTVPRAGCRPS